MDLAITRVSCPISQQGGSQQGGSRQGVGARDAAPDERWDVVCLQHRCGVEVAQPLASFGHRFHAEAFLSDLLAETRSGGLPDGHGST